MLMMTHRAGPTVALSVLGNAVLLWPRPSPSTVEGMPTTLITGANKAWGSARALQNLNEAFGLETACAAAAA